MSSGIAAAREDDQGREGREDTLGAEGPSSFMVILTWYATYEELVL